MTVPTVSQSTIPTLPDRYNVSTILDRNLEAGRGAKVALRGAGGEATYQQLVNDACAGPCECPLQTGRPENAAMRQSTFGTRVPSPKLVSPRSPPPV